VADVRVFERPFEPSRSYIIGHIGDAFVRGKYHHCAEVFLAVKALRAAGL